MAKDSLKVIYFIVCVVDHLHQLRVLNWEHVLVVVYLVFYQQIQPPFNQLLAHFYHVAIRYLALVVLCEVVPGVSALKLQENYVVSGQLLYLHLVVEVDESCIDSCLQVNFAGFFVQHYEQGRPKVFQIHLSWNFVML